MGDRYDRNGREYSKNCRPPEASLRLEESRISRLLLHLHPQLFHLLLTLSSCRSSESCPASAEIILRKKMQCDVNTGYFEKGVWTCGRFSESFLYLTIILCQHALIHFQSYLFLLPCKFQLLLQPCPFFVLHRQQKILVRDTST